MTAQQEKPIRVLDFGQVMAGPLCARLMADLGAEVIKIEAPEGDTMRSRPPLRSGCSAYFGALNAGKRSVVLDLKADQGRQHAFALASQADVIVENYRPGVMDRLGLGYERVSAVNPRLIYCAISGFGQTGAGARKPAYAPMIHAASGLDLALMDFVPGSLKPAPTGMFFADVLAAVYAWGAIQTALYQRERSGLGQQIDVALMDSLLSMMIYECQEVQFPQGRKRHVYVPVRALDGFVVVVPLSGRNFSAMLTVLDNPAWGTDQRFATSAGREAHWTELMQHVESWTSIRPAEVCEALMMQAGVPCSRYRTIADALADPVALERGVMGTVEDGAGSFKVPNPPFRMSGTVAGVRRRIPDLGEGTQEFLAFLPPETR